MSELQYEFYFPDPLKEAVKEVSTEKESGEDKENSYQAAAYRQCTKILIELAYSFHARKILASFFFLQVYGSGLKKRKSPIFPSTDLTLVQ